MRWGIYNLGIFPILLEASGGSTGTSVARPPHSLVIHHPDCHTPHCSAVEDDPEGAEPARTYHLFCGSGTDRHQLADLRLGGGFRGSSLRPAWATLSTRC